MNRKFSVYWVGFTFLFLSIPVIGDDALWIESKDHIPVCASHHNGNADISDWLEAAQCEKDTEWVDETSSEGNELCHPRSIAHKLDLSPLRQELAKTPHLCITPKVLHPPKHCPSPPSENPLSTITDLPDMKKAFDLTADAGPQINRGKELGKGATKTVYLTHMERDPEMAVAAYDFKSTDKKAAQLDFEIQVIDSLFQGPNPMDPSGLIRPLGTHRRQFGDAIKTTRYMELMSAKSMSSFVPNLRDKNKVENNKKFTVKEALHVSKDLCKTIQGLHDRKVVHRDIKPANLFYDGHKLKVGDFDIAYSLNGNFLEVPGFDEMSNSAPWAAPELLDLDFDKMKADHPQSLEEAKKELFEVHTRSDDWAAATTLLNILTHEWAPWQAMVDENGKAYNYMRTAHVIVEFGNPDKQPIIHSYIEKALNGLTANHETDKHSVDKLKDFLSCALTSDRKSNPCDIKKKCDTL